MSGTPTHVDGTVMFLVRVSYADKRMREQDEQFSDVVSAPEPEGNNSEWRGPRLRFDGASELLSAEVWSSSWSVAKAFYEAEERKSNV